MDTEERSRDAVTDLERYKQLLDEYDRAIDRDDGRDGRPDWTETVKPLFAEMDVLYNRMTREDRVAIFVHQQELYARRMSGQAEL